MTGPGDPGVAGRLARLTGTGVTGLRPAGSAHQFRHYRATLADGREVFGCDESLLVISWLPAGAPDAAAAERFGRELAGTHAAGAGQFGAPWPGFIASLPLANDPPADGGWPGSPAPG